MSLIKLAPASCLQNYVFGALLTLKYLEFTVWFQILFMSCTCDLHDSCGENIATYLWDNL